MTDYLTISVKGIPNSIDALTKQVNQLAEEKKIEVIQADNKAGMGNNREYEALYILHDASVQLSTPGLFIKHCYVADSARYDCRSQEIEESSGINLLEYYVKSLAQDFGVDCKTRKEETDDGYELYISVHGDALAVINMKRAIVSNPQEADVHSKELILYRSGKEVSSPCPGNEKKRENVIEFK